MRGIFDLDKRRDRIAQLEEQTALPGFWDDAKAAQTVLREVSLQKKWVTSHDDILLGLNDSEELIEMVEDNTEDARELVESLDSIVTKLSDLEFRTLLSGPDDHRDAIISIHPGAGGTESQDWAEMLFRLYNRWVERRGFTLELMDYQPGEEAGMKSATFEVKGDYAFGYLQAESGVHRLVRISPFDANSRRHTSFASVHVFPVADDVPDIEIKDDEIRVDTYRASGAGGQHVNKTSSAIRITHLPTGIVVTCQSERSQHKNKDSAFAVLRARLYQRKREEEEKKLQKFSQNKKKIEWGSQIRSYVFHPYNMVKDHRTGAETSNTQAVMDGDIDRFIEAFLADPTLKGADS